MFYEVKKQSFDEREREMMAFWEKAEIFQKSVSSREKGPFFATYDGPPFATGLPHYGHLLAGTIKDVVPRYKTMKGYHVPRRFGWDCHGLPVENEIEKEHGLSGAASIEEFGIAKFNEACRSIVLRYAGEWRGIVSRMGRWVDFEKTYHTMDKSFMESVWWVFKQLHEKGLVYEGYKVMPFSAKLGTPLSNFEATQNYQDVDDPSLTVGFAVDGMQNTHLLAWTTTPWTLISNLALCIGPDHAYAFVRSRESDRVYILAADRVNAVFKDPESYEIEKTVKGSELVGLRYKPLFPYFEEAREQSAFQVIADDFVTLEDGTGIVHTAPGFGEADFYACQNVGIDPVCPVDKNGCFTDEIADYKGMFVKDADKEIIKRLKDQGAVFHHGTCRHRYPMCWRSDTPLIYRVMTTWFVSVEKIKEKLIANNQEVRWVPGHVKEGRFGKWLEGARDWAVSRNRYWGTPLPIWRAETGEIHVIGSIEELEALTGKKVDDLHRHFIDDLTFEKDGKTFSRVPEVFDCWFESGSMPYAQNHYPFEFEDEFDGQFPADYIAEGLDQTRGWFYTLMVLSTALFDKPAFKNVIVNGIILAEDGNKMSKRLKNYPDPMDMVKKYGADAIRLYLLHSPAVKADDLCFTERGVELVLRQVMIPLWNAHTFFNTYARIYGYTPEVEVPDLKSRPALDQWMVSLLHKLIHDVEEGMDAYDLSAAVEPFVAFVDQLTNWYIRRSRRRFWSEEDSGDRRSAFATLYEVLVELSKIAAPFVPFIAEAMYRTLRQKGSAESVHLADFPRYDAEKRLKDTEEAMSLVQTVVSLGHGLRKENKLKVRQPLSVAHIASHDQDALRFLETQKHLIAEELNVKTIELSEEEEQFVQFSVHPNFRILGKKVGKRMKAVQQVIAGFDRDQMEVLRSGESLAINIEGEELTLTSEDVEVRRSVHEGMIAANQGHLTIALETELDDALLIEGLAREVVNKVNTMRRDQGFQVSDRIVLKIDTTDRVKACFEAWGEYIQNEVLAPRVEFGECAGTEWDLNGERAKMSIELSTAQTSKS